MITYTDFGNFISSGNPNAGGEQIPKNLGCPPYVRILAEVIAGTSEIIPYVPTAAEAAAKNEVVAKKSTDDQTRDKARRLYESGDQNDKIAAIILLYEKGLL